jgi:hypothetical protein
MPSHRANHYGKLVERQAAEKYPVYLERASWHDARRDLDDSPVEIKSTMYEHADGQPGNFKLYDQYHEKLRNQDGWYIFGVYRIRGRGVQVLKWDMRHSSRLPLLDWHGGGDHRDARQSKVGIGEIF